MEALRGRIVKELAKILGNMYIKNRQVKTLASGGGFAYNGGR